MKRKTDWGLVTAHALSSFAWACAGAVWAYLLLSIIGCSPSHVPPAGYDCVAACQNLRSLSCLANDGRADNGDACEVWYCETPRLPSSTCVSHASSCEAARACK